jgi:hypothetical protein
MAPSLWVKVYRGERQMLELVQQNSNPMVGRASHCTLSGRDCWSEWDTVDGSSGLLTRSQSLVANTQRKKLGKTLGNVVVAEAARREQQAWRRMGCQMTVALEVT